MTAVMSPAQERKLAELRFMQRIALGLLVAAAAVFVWMASLPPSPWVSGVKMVSEAAMVGALADWFAVTALFRRPLGLPIRHTAIIPASKDRIGTNLAEFVRDEFLNPATLVGLLQRHEPAQRLADWLNAPGNAALLSKQVTRLLSATLDAVGDAQVERLIHRAVHDLMGRVDLNQAMAKGLESLTHEGRHQALLDAGLENLAEWLREDASRKMVAEGVVRWLKQDHPVKEKVLPTEWLGDKASEMLSSALQTLLADVGQDRGHHLRKVFNASVEKLITRLRTDPAWARKAEELREYLRNDPTLRSYVQTLWAGLRDNLRRDLNDPDSSIAKEVQALSGWLGRSLADDSALRQSIDQHLVRWVGGLAPDISQFVGRHIQDTVQRWDAQALSRLVELNIGRDLQFIRISGTLVGGFIGGLLFLLSSVPAWLRATL